MSRQHIDDIVKDKSKKGFIDKFKASKNYIMHIWKPAWVSLFFALVFAAF